MPTVTELFKSQLEKPPVNIDYVNNLAQNRFNHKKPNDNRSKEEIAESLQYLIGHHQLFYIHRGPTKIAIASVYSNDTKQLDVLATYEGVPSDDGSGIPSFIAPTDY
jgi:hypothetical protein